MKYIIDGHDRDEILLYLQEAKENLEKKREVLPLSIYYKVKRSYLSFEIGEFNRMIDGLVTAKPFLSEGSDTSE